ALSLAKASASATVIASYTTGADGKFQFDDLEDGIYNIKANYTVDDSTILVGLFQNVEYQGEKVDLGSDTLQLPGTILIEVTVNYRLPEGVECFIPGITQVYSSEESQGCFIPNVPEGAYNLNCSFEGYLPADYPDIVVLSDDTTLVSDKYLEADPEGEPPAPVNLFAKPKNQEGAVLLTWDEVQVADLEGYQVYRKDPGSNSFVLLNPDSLVIGTSFMDSVFTDIYDITPKEEVYKITAVDADENESLFSVSFTVTAYPPNVPLAPVPAIGDTVDNLSPLLAWAPVTVETDQSIVYDIYLDEDPEPTTIYARGQSNSFLLLSNLQDNTVYYWQVVAHINGDQILGAVWSFVTPAATIGDPPHTPSSPTPGNNAVDQDPLAVILQWQGGDPDSGDVVVYDVFLGTVSDSLIKVASSITETSRDVSPLEHSTDYFWKIVASDGQSSVKGPVWKFTTEEADPTNKAPDSASNPSPIDGATGVEISITLSWTCSDPDGDALTYDVLMGTTADPVDKVASGISSSSQEVSLDANTTYYWKVIASDGQRATSSAVWQFKTRASSGTNQAPHTPSSPTPDSGAVDEVMPVTLTWSGGDPDGDTVTYTVELGTSPIPTIKVSIDQKATSFLTSGLQAGTPYYWRITASDGQATTVGPVWDFKTKAADSLNHPPTVQLISPAQYATDLDPSLTLTWTGEDPDADEVVYDVRLGTSEEPPTISYGQPETSLPVSGLTLGKIYYWQVVAFDGQEYTSSEMWSFRIKDPVDPNDPPNAPENPTPPDLKDSLGTIVTLSWECT
ncbi:MAG: hypothetical protein ACYSWP_21555, partial [Planctomycetota bacterium]